MDKGTAFGKRYERGAEEDSDSGARTNSTSSRPALPSTEGSAFMYGYAYGYLLDAGLEMDEATTAAAFLATPERSTAPRRTDERDGHVRPPRHGPRDGRGDNAHGLPRPEIDEATTVGAMGRVPSPADALALRWAASAVSAFLDAGLEMDDATTAAVFRAMADAVDGTEAPWLL